MHVLDCTGTKIISLDGRDIVIGGPVDYYRLHPLPPGASPSDPDYIQYGEDGERVHPIYEASIRVISPDGGVDFILYCGYNAEVQKIFEVLVAKMRFRSERGDLIALPVDGPGTVSLVPIEKWAGMLGMDMYI